VATLLVWAWPALPPFHTRCMGVMQLALATGLWAGRLALDPAALRLPLAGAAVWALSALGALVVHKGDAPALAPPALLGLAVTGLLALLLVRAPGDDPVPAERPDRTAQLAAAALLVLAAGLLGGPAAVAPAWPWKMQPSTALLYAPPLLGLGVMLLLAAVERRSYVRAPAWQALLVLAAGVLVASGWHAAAFATGRWATWAWAAAWPLLLVLALVRLVQHTQVSGRRSWSAFWR
jgi:hypothetical protein